MTSYYILRDLHQCRYVSNETVYENEKLQFIHYFIASMYVYVYMCVSGVCTAIENPILYRYIFMCQKLFSISIYTRKQPKPILVSLSTVNSYSIYMYVRAEVHFSMYSCKNNYIFVYLFKYVTTQHS